MKIKTETVEFPVPEDSEKVGIVYVFKRGEKYGMRIVGSDNATPDRVLEKAYSLLRQHGQKKIMEAVAAGKHEEPRIIRPA